MYELHNASNIFDLRNPLNVKNRGQTPKTLKSNISNTVRDREEASMEVWKKVLYELKNDENIFDLSWPLKVKGQNQTPKTSEVEYLKNGTK